MENDELLLKKRFAELAKRADNSGTFTYTPFLSLAERDILERMRAELPAPFETFGGAKGCERVVARFGTAELFGYDEAYPIKLLLAKPNSAKFADSLTHRDVLGALMALGIERSATGDIVLRDNMAYIFCSDRIAEFIKNEFTAAKHTPMNCSYADELPEGELYRLNEQEVTVASARLDCVAAAVFKLPRADMQELIHKGLAFVNGRQTGSASKELAQGDIVSVRGYGRFVYSGELRRTRKDRLVVRVGRYE